MVAGGGRDKAMDYMKKADLLSAYLTETENGFNREDMEDAVLFTLSDERGAGFGVTLPAEGPARVVTVLGRLDGPLPGESEAIVLHSLNRLNEHLTFGKIHLREDGMLYFWAPYYETGPFDPSAVLHILAAIARQGATAGQTFFELMRTLLGGPEV
jgi:hypothetical protein